MSDQAQQRWSIYSRTTGHFMGTFETREQAEAAAELRNMIVKPAARKIAVKLESFMAFPASAWR